VYWLLPVSKINYMPVSSWYQRVSISSTLDRRDILSLASLTLYNMLSLVQLSLSAEQCQEAVSHLWRMEGCRGCIQNQWICHRPELTLSLLKSRNINQTYTHVWFQGWNGARLTKHTQPPGLLLLFSITVIHNYVNPASHGNFCNESIKTPKYKCLLFEIQ